MWIVSNCQNRMYYLYPIAIVVAGCNLHYGCESLWLGVTSQHVYAVGSRPYIHAGARSRHYLPQDIIPMVHILGEVLCIPCFPNSSWYTENFAE